MRRLVTPGWLAAIALLLLGIVGGVLLLAPSDDTYIFLPDEAHPVDPVVTVPGESPSAAGEEDEGGGIYFVDVLVRRATLMERLVPSIREGASLVPAQAINPTGLSDARRRAGNLREMTRSQAIAAAVALRQLGYDVSATPRGALVETVFPGTPAAGELEPTDVIVAVDGKQVRTPSDLRRLVSAKRPGSQVKLAVRRGEERVDVELTTARDPQEPARSIVGVAASQDANIRLPVRVKIDAGNVGGPSAGLPFALDIYDELGRDIDRGHRIAATGEIELDGDVLPVGGLKQKTIGARRSGVDTFLVPAGENAEEARKHAGDMRVVPVRNFQQALRALQTLEPIRQETSAFGR
jgi:PDZ domain-containing protein